MAIDTAERRRNVSSIGLPWMGPGVTPNAAKDDEWRQQVTYTYSGIPADAPTAGAGQGWLRAFLRRRRL